ncbi:MAG: type I-B CRISPR-associated protein Cas5b [Candidatus Jettenia sp.]|nr:MAG: type I-B CRISPR-associated protein Cas5b [Candidatus Jettenia sp.]
MQVLRVHIRGWTASYRVPIFMMGDQPTFKIPPFSTVYGIISAAVGRFITSMDTGVGVVAFSENKANDLEKIHSLTKKFTITPSKPIRREFLHSVDVFLYLTEKNYQHAFENPYYPILLGRSSDLGYVKKVKIITLQQTNEAEFRGTLLPFEEPFRSQVASPIMSLPICFTDSAPRCPIAVKIFYMVEKKARVNAQNLFIDAEMNWGVWIYPKG